MKNYNAGVLFLILAIVLCSIFISNKKINAQIEETIRNNYTSEINLLKEKLDKQSELINSIIKVNDKHSQSGNNNNNGNKEYNESEQSSAEQKDEFEYVKENGGITITKYNGNATTVKIPNKIEQLPVLKVGENAFSDSKVKSVTLPSDCVEIDWFAFYGCFALTSVYIPNGVEIIGYGAFDACSKSMTIYCENGSYAEKYAQSFGISYSNYR